MSVIDDLVGSFKEGYRVHAEFMEVKDKYPPGPEAGQEFTDRGITLEKGQKMFSPDLTVSGMLYSLGAVTQWVLGGMRI